MRRSEFIKIVNHYYPTWETKHESSEHIRFLENGVVVGGVTSFCPYTNRIHKTKSGRHIAMFITHYSTPGLKALGYINGVGVHS